MRKTINIEQKNGNVEQVDLLNLFEIPSTGKTFMILSKDESAGENLEKIYISEVEEKENGVYSMLGINSNEDWELVKKAMKEIVKQNTGVEN